MRGHTKYPLNYFLPMQSFAKGAGTLITAIFVSCSLLGCAAQMAYREGRNLVEQGKVEEGLSKLQEAVQHAPRDVEYKTVYLQTRDRIIANLLEKANRSVAAGKRTEAEEMYRRILKIDPTNDRALSELKALESARQHMQLLTEAESAWTKKDTETAEFKLHTILTENPRHASALALKKAISEKTVQPPIESVLSAAYKKPISIEFKDVALKQVFEVISRTSSLNFLFDKDVKTDQKTSIFLKNSTIESAVNFTLLTNQLEQRILDSNTILIYPNTPAKQKDYQELVVKTFFLANSEAKTVANTLKTILKSKDVVVDDKLNMLIVRDSPEVIKLAEKLVSLHDVPEPEVMLEVEILEIKRTRLQELGIKWPANLTLTPLPSTSGGTLTLNDLQTNLNSRTIAVGITPVTINARVDDSDANILANPRIRARNHEKAKILIGERLPNITTTSTSTGFVSESINYVDVGLKLDVEPTVHLDNDVAIKVSLEVSNIVSQLQTKSGAVAYQIGTRTASTVLRLKDGENQVLAGLINDEDRRSGTKVPGIGEVPVLGRLFGSATSDNQKTEIVLSITPHIIRNIQRPDSTLAEFRSGTDTNFRPRPESGAMMPTAVPASLPDTQPKNPLPAPPVPGMPQSGAVNGGGLPGVSGVNNGTVVNNTDQQANGTQLQWMGPPQIKVGETFGVRLTMQSDMPVTSLPMSVSYDPKLLQVVSIVEGDFIKQGGAQANFSSRVDANGPIGQVQITDTRVGGGGATALGDVMTINFRAVAPADQARVQLLTISPTGLSGNAVVARLPLPHSLQILP